MLGSGLLAYTYRNVSSNLNGTNQPTIAILPIDATGRFFGAFWFKRSQQIVGNGDLEEFATITRAQNPLAGSRLVADFRRNGTILATTQIWGKRQYRIDQRYSDTATSSWRNTTSTGAAAQLFNATPQPPVAPWVFLSPALASYGNAYFPPAGWPAATPSTTPNDAAAALAVHAEPFYVCFDRNDGDNLDFLLRTFVDYPNSTLGANALNDDAPPADFGLRSAEVAVTYQNQPGNEAAYFLDGWIVRIGPTDAEQITAIPNDPNWGIVGGGGQT